MEKKVSGNSGKMKSINTGYSVKVCSTYRKQAELKPKHHHPHCVAWERFPNLSDYASGLLIHKVGMITEPTPSVLVRTARGDQGKHTARCSDAGSDPKMLSTYHPQAIITQVKRVYIVFLTL